MNFDTYVDRSGHNTAKYTQRKAVFGNNDILPMWVADMDIISPSFIQEAIQERALHPVFGYVDKPERAIDAQLTWMRTRQNYTVDKEWLISCHSIVTSIHIAINAFSEVGDEVIIMSPVYHEFAHSVKQEGRNLISWNLVRESGKYHFDIEDLKKQLSSRSKVLILCSPHNPLGRVWTRDELQVIGDFCIEHNIVIVADEMHSDLVYTPHIFTPMASISSAIQGRCITLQGPGKTFNLTGLGLSSVIISDPELRKKFYKVYERYHPSYGTAFSQVAFEAAYRNGAEWLEDLLLYLDKNQQALISMLQKHQSKISMIPSEATFLAWLDCSGLGMNDRDLMRFFVEEAKLGLSAGVQFGPGGENHMRLNFAVPQVTMQKAIEQLDKALERQKSNSVTA